MVRRCNIGFWGLVLGFVLLTGCRTEAGALDEVDRLLDEHPAIEKQYQAHIDSLQSSTRWSSLNDAERFAVYGQFYDLYRSYNIDSQQVYTDKRMALARQTVQRDMLQLAQMNRAEVMMRSGMYHEAMGVLDRLAVSGERLEEKGYYFHLRRTLYGLMADFATEKETKAEYLRQTQAYRDSIVAIEPAGSFVHELVRADALCAEGQYAEALEVVKRLVVSGEGLEENGIMEITKAQIYRAMGDREAEKRCLIASACADLRGAVREYIALRELALLLYQEGDIDHAYRYMRCAIEDATAGGIHGRTMEVSEVYPIIESAYEQQRSWREKLLYGLIGSMALIALLLCGFLVYVLRQHKKTAAMNARLQVANEDLERSNRIKTVYVGHYMEMTSLLIDRFDSWRKNLNQYMKTSDLKRLQAEIGSQRFTQEQLNAFYHDFDEAFLHIFPNFVEEVKTLLVDNAEIRIKPNERLNTDLRVLALIRLGITDSVQIASFLRYSLSTIYNSRTRMRNLAKGDRDQFEALLF